VADQVPEISTGRYGFLTIANADDDGEKVFDLTHADMVIGPVNGLFVRFQAHPPDSEAARAETCFAAPWPD